MLVQVLLKCFKFLRLGRVLKKWGSNNHTPFERFQSSTPEPFSIVLMLKSAFWYGIFLPELRIHN